MSPQPHERPHPTEKARGGQPASAGSANTISQPAAASLRYILSLFTRCWTLMRRLLRRASKRTEDWESSRRNIKMDGAREAEEPGADGEVVVDEARDLDLRTKAYAAERERLIKQDEAYSWCAEAERNASEAENRAARIIHRIREHERDNLFGNTASEAIPGPETRDMGGQFLTNKERIHDSLVYKMAVRMPKGAHLHLHFNAELMPDELIKKARDRPDNMFVRSTLPLVTEEDYRLAEIVFNILPEDTLSVDIFSRDYKPEFRKPGAQPWMLWKDFSKVIEQKTGRDSDEWVKEKMVLSEEEAYGITQTTNGVWARFNQATRCFKGLMNYESVYRWYITHAIDNMIADGVMYAELRPMLMDKAIPTDDGRGSLDHAAQMRIIIDGVLAKQAELQRNGQLDKFPFGVKIIYCAPRSIPKPMMQREIDDCIALKQRFPDLICGFDLVGAEDRPNHVGFYHDQLLAMQARCAALGIAIPFMFHAGETLLDTGGSKDPRNSNLYDAVSLGAKRIGHGFSLLKHPALVREFKRLDICVELCPTSNELLHLCRNIKEHPYPEILATGIPCTVNSDNPSLFSNSVSHEFYQIMVGSPTMSLHGWRQLAEWSIRYSCLTAAEQERARDIFAHEWQAFVEWIVSTYGSYAEGLVVQGL